MAIEEVHENYVGMWCYVRCIHAYSYPHVSEATCISHMLSEATTTNDHNLYDVVGWVAVVFKIIRNQCWAVTF